MFKVGDKIVYSTYASTVYTIESILEDKYGVSPGGVLYFADEHKFKLAPGSEFKVGDYIRVGTSEMRRVASVDCRMERFYLEPSFPKASFGDYISFEDISLYHLVDPIDIVTYKIKKEIGL